MRPPGSAGGPPPLRARFFAALLRGEFAAPVLAPVDAGAISLPLGMENAVPSSSSPCPGGRNRRRHNFGVDDAAGIIGRPSPFQGVIIIAPLRGEHADAVPPVAPVIASAEADVIINAVVNGGDASTAFLLPPGRRCRRLFSASSQSSSSSPCSSGPSAPVVAVSVASAEAVDGGAASTLSSSSRCPCRFRRHRFSCGRRC